MDREFHQLLSDKLQQFREWSRHRSFNGCRLVQYCGVECIGGIDIPLAEAEAQIEGVFAEGFGVDWTQHQDRLYLAVWEPAEMDWSWTQVFAEQHLQDLKAFEPPFNH